MTRTQDPFGERSPSGDPRVSLILACDDADETLALLAQSLVQVGGDVEFVCVLEESSPAARAARALGANDPRVKPSVMASGVSTFDARRAGVAAARAPYILFVDGRTPPPANPTEGAHRAARHPDADIIGLDLRSLGTSRATAVTQFTVDAAIAALYLSEPPADIGAHAFLFAKKLLERVYVDFPSASLSQSTSTSLVTLLALARARRPLLHPSPDSRWTADDQGTSEVPQDVDEWLSAQIEEARDLARAQSKVEALVRQADSPAIASLACSALRANHLGALLHDLHRLSPAHLRVSRLRALLGGVDTLDVLRGAARFEPAWLPWLAQTAGPPPRLKPEVTSVLLSTGNLRTGGLQGVVTQQADALNERGIETAVVLAQSTDRDSPLPDGVAKIALPTADLPIRLDAWVELCREHRPDAVLDHDVLYNDEWPWFALVAQAMGIPVIGWLHNFALRPVFDGTDRLDILTRYLPTLSKVVALTPLDVAFWKLRGLERTAFVPNPLSTLARLGLAESHSRVVGTTLNICWWGRLDPNTKQVLHLVDVAAELAARSVDFHLTILGPDSRALTARDVRSYASAKGVGDRVTVLGERRPEELAAVLRTAHLFLMTSAIEGSPLTVVEAQAWGLPVVMYSLPWAVPSGEDAGILAVPQGQSSALAAEIVAIAADPDRYAELSGAARRNAERAASLDVGELLLALVEDRLPESFSPSPTLADAELLIDWFVRYSARNAEALSRVRAVERERDAARRKLEQISRGASFRIGRAITSAARKLSGRA
ncbi:MULTISPECIES: glycosyltransferase family 4 protein [unclassified Microbacterium]|uniref:glycosyltransferase family 4 protein n=1 Tax=unclassified Microbacterium TaxID=2609290 RepID=UPI003C2D745B